MNLLLPEIFKKCNKLKTREERIAYLQKTQSPAMKDIIRIAFDDDIVSIMPEGAPPYTADDAPEGHSMSTLYKKHMQLGFYFKGKKAKDVSTVKRETMFIQLLESLHSTEAEMLIKAKDKNLPYRGITKKLCQEAFPGLIVK